MTIYSYQRGHQIEFRSGQWVYADTGEIIDYERPCIRCNRLPTKENYDACVGYMPNAISICCGHGVTEPITIVDNKGFKQFAKELLG